MSKYLKEYFLQGFNSDFGADLDVDGVNNRLSTDDTNLVGLCCYCYVAGMHLRRFGDGVKDEAHAERVFAEFSDLVLYTDCEKGVLRDCRELFNLDEPSCEVMLRHFEADATEPPADVENGTFFSMVRKLEIDPKHKNDLLYDVCSVVGGAIIFRAVFGAVGEFYFSTDYHPPAQFLRSEPDDRDATPVDCYADEYYESAGNLFWVYSILWSVTCLGQDNIQSFADQLVDEAV